ncbi:malate synthase A [Pontibacillus litoralis]|uniref:Malate synthase n=1 Tax=Pontibacillus litoralis JSM 072002 TaxID=1385512 RepID=A0A0A5G7I8_9BACI|nr:malate synthase A [Pontibacillus litoralis]KGX87050.1 malate synthase [Pontibacillus litoralis JSM 072002]
METKHSTIQVQGEMYEGFERMLSEEALQFIEQLHHQFEERRQQLLTKRQQVQQQIKDGQMPDFLPETESVRKGSWTIAPLPADLKDRRVEITGPVDRKMVINALNSGAKAFMADFEDSNAPTWYNTIQGQNNLYDAIRRTISFQNDKGKVYELKEETAVLMVRPRGWHLEEKHITVNGERMSAALVDFGLYFFHNAKALIHRQTGPYFYLPKMENHLEARLWNDVFVFAQQQLGIPQGTIKATVLIETILATFEVDEILYELKEHSAGLNCGRWDYIFSYLKKFRYNPGVILPDRSQVTMESPFMRAYSMFVIQTCHKRNAPAIGGMAAQIPIKGDDEANAIAFQKVQQDKEREVKNGHDGTWIAHPGMIQAAIDVFDYFMPEPNQISHKLLDISITAKDLLQVPEGDITEEGLRTNISVGIQYIASWLCGRGAAPINHLMEDAATAEISRAQVWQWIRHPKGQMKDGRYITFKMVEKIQQEELQKIAEQVGEATYKQNRYEEAAELFTQLIQEDEFAEFLTIPAYERL